MSIIEVGTQCDHYTASLFLLSADPYAGRAVYAYCICIADVMRLYLDAYACRSYARTATDTDTTRSFNGVYRVCAANSIGMHF